jgi:cytoskeletal protein CcmA (bactofilin family)
MKKRNPMITFLGKETEFEGKLAFRGTVRLDGHFRGEITAGENLIVGEEGMIEANLHAVYIVISGEVHGNILADQRVDIHPPGKVFGNIQAPAVVIDEGVIFEGKTRMYQAKDADQTKSETAGAVEYAGEPSESLRAVCGVITDQDTGKPVKNALIKCEGVSKKSTLSNAAGYYELINLKDGNCRLTIKARGYRKAKGKVEVSGEGKYEENYALNPK